MTFGKIQKGRKLCDTPLGIIVVGETRYSGSRSLPSWTDKSGGIKNPSSSYSFRKGLISVLDPVGKILGPTRYRNNSGQYHKPEEPTSDLRNDQNCSIQSKNKKGYNQKFYKETMYLKDPSNKFQLYSFGFDCMKLKVTIPFTGTILLTQFLPSIFIHVIRGSRDT